MFYLISIFVDKSNLNLLLLSSSFCSVGITLTFSFFKIIIMSLSVPNIVYVVLFEDLCYAMWVTLFFIYYTS